MYSQDFDNLYREPKDGMISLRSNYDTDPSSHPDVLFGKSIPKIELVTLVDLSTLWEEKQKLAGKIAE